MARQRRGIPKPATRVEDTRHVGDERTNIPTAELEGLAEAAEKQPKTVLYPRDPSLDPQLVWKGKDEQDAHPLEVPSVPIYIQEHISPRALIEDLRATAQAGREQQLDLFGDFNGMEFDERVEFYQHQMKWTNRMILGDSLLVMTSLAEKEGLKGHVQTIYVDPPYGIKFGSNWQVSTRRRDVHDGKESDLTRQPEQVRAYRDTWELGIHSYLSYLRDRVVVARELLTESGSVFVQIGDQNLHLVRTVLDEVFGADNFVSQITYVKTSGQNSPEARVNSLAGIADFVVWYARDRSRLKYRQLFWPKASGAVGGTKYRSNDEAPAMADSDMTSAGEADADPFEFGGRVFQPSAGRHWRTNNQGRERLRLAGRLMISGKSLRFMSYLTDYPAFPLNNVWNDIGGIQSRTDGKVYVVQTAPLTVQRCLLMTTDPGDLVLDPTCGSGTTAYVAEQWGRRWITIDTSRVALALARSRLMAAKYPWYLLADSEAGVRKDADMNGQAPPSPMPATTGDVRRGFAYERVPHVTLKSIAQNPNIHEGMRQEEIDAAIERHAETEILYDRPYEDRKVVRVSGPFTVESLSPHRVVADGPEDYVGEPEALIEDSARFADMVLDNLRKAGVQNQVKDQRLSFDTLERFAGRGIQAEGWYDEGGARRHAAVAIGPQYGTVGSELVREAAKEAAGWFDILIVAGFAFDARAEELSQLGNMPVLYARMNADLLMGDALKKTAVGNLFTVFGQPDIDVRTLTDGQVQVDLNGIDVYDPTTGELRSDSPDEIAAWFIDTDYNGESFFVRHAYFCGGDRPYEKLARALKADVDEATWETLYSATSRPFPRPASGKIAVKVINHYGDEILKVYEV